MIDRYIRAQESIQAKVTHHSTPLHSTSIDRYADARRHLLAAVRVLLLQPRRRPRPPGPKLRPPAGPSCRVPRRRLLRVTGALLLRRVPHGRRRRPPSQEPGRRRRQRGGAAAAPRHHGGAEEEHVDYDGREGQDQQGWLSLL